jgi:putative acetyltransferase
MSSSLLIRKATPVDLKLLTDLFRETILTVNICDYSLKQVQVWSEGADNKDAWLKRIEEQFFLCAFSGNELTGFASLEKNGYLDLMYVHKDWQGRGVATSLYKELENYAVQNKLIKISSDVSITARTFFEKRGFKVAGEQKKFIGETEFLNYRMEKII